MATYSVSPLSMSGNITGMLCSLSLSSGSSEIRLANLSKSISIYLPRANASVVANITIGLQDKSTVISSFNVSDTNQTVIFGVELNSNLSLRLLLAPGFPPNESYYTHRTVLNYTSEGINHWFVTPEMFQQTTGVWYISVNLFNSTWRPGLSLDITIFTTKCMYWDTKELSWMIDGCMVGEWTRPNLTHCLCNHLTMFGSSFFVTPNFVDVSLTAQYFATVSQNYVVVVLLSCFFALYLMTAFWAFYADRRAQTRRKMTLLEDTHPCAQYNYLLSVQTGSRKAAGTSANVTVKLIGLETESETHHLSDREKPVFERGADDMFLLATPFPLGDLRSIRLQHDNTGGHPSWYVDKVVIQDLQTHQVWHFLCSSWLSSERGEGTLKKNFHAAQNNEIASFRNIFQTRTSSGFRDEHIWVSVVDPPARSPFTRLQRVSCCMSLLLCTMAINIAFWNMAHDEKSPVIFSIGSFKLTWEQIMVGVESALLMFPINILIITIFRSIKPRFLQPDDNDYTPDLKPMAITMPTILKETEDLLNVLSRSKRNQVTALTEGLESASDISPALDRVHDLIQLMQGESDGESHWVYCGRYLQSCLSHLCMYLERLEEKAFPSPMDQQQTLGKANLLLSKAQMVLTSHTSFCPAGPTIPKKRGSNFWLPWWFAFLGWFLLLSISAISTYFTLIYGFKYGKEKSIQWVISLGLSLFQSIFILQPLKVIGMAIFFALLLKPVVLEENEEIELLLRRKSSHTF
ncbi:polycystin-1-like protein 2 [Aplochiton taeniatus]